MYKTPRMIESELEVNNTTQGETIEEKVIRLIENKEPIKDGVPTIFTDKKDGVNAAYNIRTDRWEIAVDALDKVAKLKAAKKDDLGNKPKEDAKIVDINKDEKAS